MSRFYTYSVSNEKESEEKKGASEAADTEGCTAQEQGVTSC